MRRIIIALLLAGAGTLSAAGLAYADGGPHGGYTVTTDACAGCHRIHTAQGVALLKTANSLALCLSCHDGTGSALNVRDGVQLSAPGSTTVTGALRGGGFTNARIDSGNATTPGGVGTAGVAVTSAHVKGTPLNSLAPQATMWGQGTAGNGISYLVTCTDCHDPMGGAGANGVVSYRILKALPGGTTTFGTAPGVTLADQATKTYATANYWNTYQGTVASTFPWTPAQMSSWCTECHTRYSANSAAGHTSSGDPIFLYKHVSDGSVTRTASPGGPYTPALPAVATYVPFCLQCHVSHGSNAAMGTNSQAVPWPGGTVARGNESTLLKIDNRGTCIACHGLPPQP